MHDDIKLSDIKYAILLIDKNGNHIESIKDYDRARVCYINVYNEKIKDIINTLNEHIRHSSTNMPEIPNKVGLFVIPDDKTPEWIDSGYEIISAEDFIEYDQQIAKNINKI